MSKLTFAERLGAAIPAALDEFVQKRPNAQPYAFALIGSQCDDYLGYAVATEGRLRRVAEQYYQLGDRCRDNLNRPEEYHREKLAIWLRWGNPDEGRRYGDFPAKSG